MQVPPIDPAFMVDVPSLSVGVANQYVYAYDSFSTYLMYKSEIQGLVWIALSEIDWSWTEAVTNKGSEQNPQWSGPTGEQINPFGRSWRCSGPSLSARRSPCSQSFACGARLGSNEPIRSRRMSDTPRICRNTDRSQAVSGGSTMRRVLFVSFANYLDDGNGASVASRAMIETLARRGFLVEVLCGPILELNREIDLPVDLAARGMSVDFHNGAGGDIVAGSEIPGYVQVELNGVPVRILLGSALPRMPDDRECQAFLRLYEEAGDRLQPDVVVTYGGGPLTREILRRARARGAATVFPLHNLCYHDPATFADVDAVLVASRFAAEHYRNTLGLDCTVLPNLVDHDRVHARERQPLYAVFVNPS